jgi:hypothetical protein
VGLSEDEKRGAAGAPPLRPARCDGQLGLHAEVSPPSSTSVWPVIDAACGLTR